MLKFFKRKSREVDEPDELARLKREKTALIETIKQTGSPEKLAALKEKLERDVDRRLAPLPDFRKAAK